MHKHFADAKSAPHNGQVEPNVSKLIKSWGFHPHEELAGGHCSQVYADFERVLKVPFQGEEMSTGFLASKALAGGLGPAVYNGDPSTGIILMERLNPATKLGDSELTDAESLAVTCDLIKGFPIHQIEGMMELSDFVNLDDPLAEQLINSTQERRFLHGDLHPENILRHGDRWIVIDPKGLVGDPAFEPTAFLRNPLDVIPFLPNLREVFLHRIESFASALQLDAWRICAWSLVDIRESKDSEWALVVEVLESLEKELRH